MARPAPDDTTPLPSAASTPPLELTGRERAVFRALSEHEGRVLSRQEIARLAGIADLSPRRCDSLIVGIRRRIGAERIRTVRRRGWMIVGDRAPHELVTETKHPQDLAEITAF